MSVTQSWFGSDLAKARSTRSRAMLSGLLCRHFGRPVASAIVALWTQTTLLCRNGRIGQDVRWADTAHLRDDHLATRSRHGLVGLGAARRRELLLRRADGRRGGARPARYVRDRHPRRARLNR